MVLNTLFAVIVDIHKGKFFFAKDVKQIDWTKDDQVVNFKLS